MSELAIRGGSPIRIKGFPGWPQVADDDRKIIAEAAEKIDVGGIERYVSCFEETFAKMNGTRHCIAVVNGTVSLELIMRGLGIGHGDEVILPPYTFIATMSSIVFTGAKPVFADIEADTCNISAASVEKKITEKTKAVIAVAVGGRPCDFDALGEVAARHGIYLITDAAQAVGAQWRSTMIGKCGIAASFSCQNSKNLTCGEGGMITTDDDELNDNIRTILSGGQRGGEYVTVGQQNSMNGLAAAVLTSQLEKLPDEILRRAKNAAYLDGRLKGCPFISPTAADDRVTVNAYHLYIALLDPAVLAERGIDRARFLQAMNAEGIPMSNGYAPLYRFGCVSSEETRRAVGVIDTSELPNSAAVSDYRDTWLYHAVLLGSFADIDDIADAAEKVWDHADELASL